MPRWTVYTRDGVDEGIAADHVDVISGALIFTQHGDRGRDLIVAYSPSTWTTVTRDEDD
jgi:hypothetical protein